MFQLLRAVVNCFFALILLFSNALKAQHLDIDLLKAINPQHPNSAFWKATTDSYVIVAATASMGSLAYAFISDDQALKYKSYELLLGIGITVVATEGLKRIVDRARPYETYPNDINVIRLSRGQSFPSGHTSLAFATATSLTLTHRKWYVAVPAFLYAGGMGYSRMYLGKHYPTDVLGGAIVGAGSSLLSHWLTKKLFPSANTPLPSTPPAL